MVADGEFICQRAWPGPTQRRCSRTRSARGRTWPARRSTRASYDEVATVAVTADELRLVRHRIAHTELSRLVARGDHARLYEVIMRGAEPALEEARHAIVVADPQLESVPFAALYDARANVRLIERVTVSMVLSASALVRAPRRPAPASVAAVALPSGEAASSVALPRAAREIAELRSLYPRAVETQPTFAALAAGARAADVVHIAGHTRRQGGAGAPVLGFADRETKSWRDIAETPFAPGRTVVLAACETLRAAESPHTFTLSLGGAFVAAGTADAIGTLTGIHDEEAYVLFRAVHRELAAGAGAPTAVQRAQLLALSSGGAASWSSIAVLTHSIPSD